MGTFACAVGCYNKTRYRIGIWKIVDVYFASREYVPDQKHPMAKASIKQTTLDQRIFLDAIWGPNTRLFWCHRWGSFDGIFVHRFIRVHGWGSDLPLTSTSNWPTNKNYCMEYIYVYLNISSQHMCFLRSFPFGFPQILYLRLMAWQSHPSNGDSSRFEAYPARWCFPIPSSLPWRWLLCRSLGILIHHFGVVFFCSDKSISFWRFFFFGGRNSRQIDSFKRSI